MIGRDGAMLAGVGLGLLGLAFILCTALSGLARRWAPRFGLIDRPGGHKGHRTPTPLGGGVAIWLTTVTLTLLGALALGLIGTALPAPLAKHASGLWLRAPELGAILGLASLIMIMGLIDDRSGLPWQIRLGVQLGLATALVVAGVRVTLFWPFTHPVLGGAVSVLWIVGLTNAFNMLDNMDGLAAGVGLIASALFAAALVAVESLFVPAILLVLVGALAGFLVHNRYPARLFMGDAGSNFIGFLLGALTIAGTFYRSEPAYSPYGVLSPLLVMAVPLYDMTSVIVIRIREGRSPFEGDRRHFSHRLVERGLTPPQAVRTIDLVTLAGGLGALLLHRMTAAGACVVVAQTVCLLGVVALLELSRTRPGAAPDAEPQAPSVVPTGPR
jgi:UDP-GlcNAc:undecaprenyl-phosphate/decaprenyl-phosphate GlcNAc-1-phosphate transferase